MDATWGQPKRRDRVEPLHTDPQARSHLHRSLMPELEVDEREASYRQIELGLTEAQADQEASRCLRCDICIGCGLCQLVCSEVGPEALQMEETSAGRLAFQDFERPGNRCIGCGACAQVCPTGAIGIEDIEGMRNTVITGTVVKTQPLLACSACGEPFQSEAHRRPGRGTHEQAPVPGLRAQRAGTRTPRPPGGTRLTDRWLRRQSATSC